MSLTLGNTGGNPGVIIVQPTPSSLVPLGTEFGVTYPNELVWRVPNNNTRELVTIPTFPGDAIQVPFGVKVEVNLSGGYVGAGPNNGILTLIVAVFGAGGINITRRFNLTSDASDETFHIGHVDTFDTYREFGAQVGGGTISLSNGTNRNVEIRSASVVVTPLVPRDGEVRPVTFLIDGEPGAGYSVRLALTEARIPSAGQRQATQGGGMLDLAASTRAYLDIEPRLWVENRLHTARQ
jgi:hypothetical protein